ncbi:MAG: hypothetical protein M3R55_09805 [Acidobacteriota bacterium]|nr:hypothetical protein [Acidobacteriota bacterium]
MTDEQIDGLVEAFLAGRVDPAAFDHASHVAVAWAILGRSARDAAALQVADGLRRITLRAGKPERYHETITQAFVRIIAARRRPGEPWGAFAARNPDLFQSGLLERYYDRDVLTSDEARLGWLEPRRPFTHFEEP